MAEKCKLCGRSIIIVSETEQIIKLNPYMVDYCSSQCAFEDGCDTMICRNCDMPFLQIQKGSNNFCSKECKGAHVKKQQELITLERDLIPCAYCERLFKPKGGTHIYCNRGCQREAALKEQEKNYFDIFERDNFRCQYCGKSPRDGIELVVDHVYPVSKGGKGDYHNLITACKKCNGHKGNKILDLPLIIDIWEGSNGEFEYEEVKEWWQKYTEQRYNLNKSRNAP